MGSERNLAVSLHSIRLATNNFCEGMILGEGGEATVFRGVSPNGGKPWAVKRLKERADPKYFIREVSSEWLTFISSLRKGNAAVCLTF